MRRFQNYFQDHCQRKHRKIKFLEDKETHTRKEIKGTEVYIVIEDKLSEAREAFSCAFWKTIRNEMENRRLPKYLINVVLSYLSDRFVDVEKIKQFK